MKPIARLDVAAGVHGGAQGVHRLEQNHHRHTRRRHRLVERRGDNDVGRDLARERLVGEEARLVVGGAQNPLLGGARLGCRHLRRQGTFGNAGGRRSDDNVGRAFVGGAQDLLLGDTRLGRLHLSRRSTFGNAGGRRSDDNVGRDLARVFVGDAQNLLLGDTRLGRLHLSRRGIFGNAEGRRSDDNVGRDLARVFGGGAQDLLIGDTRFGRRGLLGEAGRHRAEGSEAANAAASEAFFIGSLCAMKSLPTPAISGDKAVTARLWHSQGTGLKALARRSASAICAGLMRLASVARSFLAWSSRSWFLAV